MRILDYTYDNHVLSHLLEGDENRYPFPFLKNYHRFLNMSGKKGLLLTDERGAWLPLSIRSRRGFKTGTILHPPIKNYQRMAPDWEGDFLQETIDFMKREKLCHRLAQPPNYAIFQVYPSNSMYCDFGTFFINLAEMTEDELFANLNSKYRQAIRSAIRKGVKVKFGNSELKSFYRLYEATMKRSNMYHESYQYFVNLYNLLGEDNIQCGVAYENGHPAGAQLTVFTQYGGYVLYAGSANKISVAGTIKYLQWENMRQLKGKGVKRFDFVGARLSDVSGTKLSGIQRFKKGFGCRMEEGYLWKTDIDSRVTRIYDELLNMKLRLQGKSRKGDIIDQENNI